MKRYFKSNGDLYYKNMYLLHMGFKLKEDMDALNLIYRLKEGFGPPDQYPGANVDKVQLEDRIVVWYTNCVDYLKREIENCDNSL